MKLLLLGLVLILAVGCSDTEHSHPGYVHQGHKYIDPTHHDISTN